MIFSNMVIIINVTVTLENNKFDSALSLSAFITVPDTSQIDSVLFETPVRIT